MKLISLVAFATLTADPTSCPNERACEQAFRTAAISASVQDRAAPNPRAEIQTMDSSAKLLTAYAHWMRFREKKLRERLEEVENILTATANRPMEIQLRADRTRLDELTRTTNLLLATARETTGEARALQRQIADLGEIRNRLDTELAGATAKRLNRPSTSLDLAALAEQLNWNIWACDAQAHTVESLATIYRNRARRYRDNLDREESLAAATTAVREAEDAVTKTLAASIPELTALRGKRDNSGQSALRAADRILKRRN